MIDSLETLNLRKKALRKDITRSENKLKGLWDEMFHEKNNKSKRYSPTQRVLNFISSSSVVIDAALLGWKLYNRFGGYKRRK